MVTCDMPRVRPPTVSDGIPSTCGGFGSGSPATIHRRAPPLRPARAVLPGPWGAGRGPLGGCGGVHLFRHHLGRGAAATVVFLPMTSNNAGAILDFGHSGTSSFMSPGGELR